MTSVNKFERLLKTFPFLSLVRSGGVDYIGIVQNVDTSVASVYLYEHIKTKELKKLFIHLGGEWWWETNRTIPIDIILGQRFAPFRNVLTTFSTKDFEILAGHSVSLKNVMQKRVKRKNIQLVKKCN